MAWKTLKMRFVGDAPLICHNARLSNPRDEYAKAMKAINAKKNNKTDADIDRLADLEFMGGLYTNEEEQPIIPSHLVEAVIVEGAKKTKRGKDAKGAVFCDVHSVITHDGPGTARELMESDKNRLVASVRVGQSRVMRTRPIFHDWSIETVLTYEDEVCNESTLIDWVEAGGTRCGIGTWRPRFGRFHAEII